MHGHMPDNLLSLHGGNFIALLERRGVGLAWVFYKVQL